MTRILICTAEYPPDPGGIGVYMHELANHLSHAGYEVGVVTLHAHSDNSTIDNFKQKQSFPIYSVSNHTDWRGYLKFTRQFKPDLLITCDLPLTFYIWAIGKLLHIPILAVAIGSEFRYSSKRIIRLVKRSIYSTSDYLVSISQFTSNLMQQLGININNVPIVYPGGGAQLIPNVDSQDLRQRYNLEGKRVLLTMGGLSYRKGQHIVLKAMPQILEKFPDVHYVMAGRDRSNGDMLALAQELDIEEHVTFVGQFDENEKSAFFNLSEFCLITSQNLNTGAVEGYGIVIIEAALCERTSIGTLDTGTQEAIIDEETGLLVPQDNVNSVAEASIRLLSDIPYRNKLAQTAYQDAITNATWEKRMMAFEAIIAELDS